MANQPIPTLPAAVTISGTEQLECVQPPGSGGTSKRVTAAQIAALNSPVKNSAELLVLAPASSLPQSRTLVVVGIPTVDGGPGGNFTVGPPSGGLTQRSITGSGSLPIVSTDCILNINPSAPLTITIPLASTRGGAPLILKALAGVASNTVTVNRTSAPDTFDSLTSFTMTTPYQTVILVPANDGVNSGWMFH